MRRTAGGKRKEKPDIGGDGRGGTRQSKPLSIWACNVPDSTLSLDLRSTWPRTSGTCWPCNDGPSIEGDTIRRDRTPMYRSSLTMCLDVAAPRPGGKSLSSWPCKARPFISGCSRPDATCEGFCRHAPSSQQISHHIYIVESMQLKRLIAPNRLVAVTS